MKGSALKIILVLIFVFTIYSTGFSLDLRDIKEGGPPIVVENGVVFRYKEPGGNIPKKVYVSGDFNNWNRPLRMFRNLHNVFVLLYNKIGDRGIVLNEGRYRYRYLVDGLWKKDPLNSNIVLDEYGTELSFFDIKNPIIVVKANPIHIKDNFYIFYYKNDGAKNVSLVGDFNFWNPYANPMHRNKSGLWEVVVDIPPGEYGYRFLVDGIYRTDPFGMSLVYDRFLKEMSFVKIAKK